MRTTEEIRDRALAVLRGALAHPGMYDHPGHIEHLLRWMLNDLAFIEGREALLAVLFQRLRDARLHSPPNYCCGITSAFQNALPDCKEFDLEVAAVMAEVASQMGYLSVPEAAIDPAGWTHIAQAWSSTPMTVSSVQAELGSPSFEIGSRGWNSALLYASPARAWIALHFRRDLDTASKSGTGDGGIMNVSVPTLRWVRLSSASLAQNLIVTSEGLRLSRRGLAHPQFLIDRWLAGDADPFKRWPDDVGDT